MLKLQPVRPPAGAKPLGNTPAPSSIPPVAAAATTLPPPTATPPQLQPLAMAPPSVAAAQQPPPLLAAPNAAAATATTSEEDFKAAEQRFHACARHDVDTRLNLLAELAALKPAEAWQLYIRMRATDLAEALPPLAVVPSGLAAPAAFELRRCVAWVGRTALAQDMQLLVGSFASVGTVPQLLDHLYLNTVASLASGAIAGACRAAATSSCAPLRTSTGRRPSASHRCTGTGSGTGE